MLRTQIKEPPNSPAPTPEAPMDLFEPDEPYLPAAWLEREAAEPPLVDQIVHRMTLGDVTGGMALVLQEIERACNSDMAETDKQTIINAALEQLDAQKISLEERVQAIHYARTSALGEAATIKAEEERLAARRKAIEDKNKRLDAYILKCLESVKKIKLPTVAVSVVTRKDARLIIDDESQLPSSRKEPDLWIFHAPTISKEKVKAAMKEGKEINGARLEDTVFLQWR